MIRSRFVTYPLCTKLRLVTNGNAFAVATNIYQDVDCSAFESDLASAEEITLFTLTEGMTTNFRWNMYFFSGFTRSTEVSATPLAIGATVVANGSLRHAAYASITQFLFASRLQIGYGNSAGTAFESATVSAVLGIKLVGQ